MPHKVSKSNSVGSVPKCPKHRRYLAKRPPARYCRTCNVQYNLTCYEARNIDCKLTEILQNCLFRGEWLEFDEKTMASMKALLLQKEGLYKRMPFPPIKK
jgi:hypothetical protein